jgi:hypothetical protein
MSFLRRKKRKLTVTQVPLSVLMRQIVYDAMLTPTEGIAEMMGLPPISDEVAEMEEDAHQDRLSKIAALLPFIDAHADILAQVATSAYMLDADKEEAEVPLEGLDHLNQLFRMVALASSVSCVSTLANIGLIESKVGMDNE